MSEIETKHIKAESWQKAINQEKQRRHNEMIRLKKMGKEKEAMQEARLFVALESLEKTAFSIEQESE